MTYFFDAPIITTHDPDGCPLLWRYLARNIADASLTATVKQPLGPLQHDQPSSSVILSGQKIADLAKVTMSQGGTRSQASALLRHRAQKQFPIQNRSATLNYLQEVNIVPS